MFSRYQTAVKHRLNDAVVKLFIRNRIDNVYVAGWISSGSTVVYQILKELGIPIKKVHGIPKHHSDALTFFTIRDPRDVVVSTARRVFSSFVKTDGLKRAMLKAIEHISESHFVEDYYQAVVIPSMVILRYENFFLGNEGILIQFLGDQLAHPVSEMEKSRLLEKVSIEANLARMKKLNDFQEFDPITQIHGNHISNKGRVGGWKSVFDRELAQRFQQTFPTILIDLKYEENDAWLGNCE